MAKSPPTPLQITMQELGEARAKMRLHAANIGEPAVEVPMEDLSVFKDAEGKWRAIIGMDKLIYLVDRVLRE